MSVRSVLGGLAVLLADGSLVRWRWPERGAAGCF